MKYIGYFDFDDARFKRNYVPAATNKMLYIIDSLIKAEYNIELISTSESIEKKFCFHRGEKNRINDNFSVTYFSTFGGQSIILRVLKRNWMLLCLFIYLLIHTKKDEKILVYHSTGYRSILSLAKKIKKFKIILEVEEIYQDCTPLKLYQIKEENSALLSADAFVFASKYLETKVNINGLPSIVVNGTYKVEPKITEQIQDGRIHIVYSGTFDPLKGGAIAAIESAKYLNERYCIHILGFGNEEQVAKIKESIGIIRPKTKCEIIYAGCLNWKDYIPYLQQCHVGLSTQNMAATPLNNSCFPSKILTYLANGLSVVSGNIPVIRQSVVGHVLNYYEDQTGESIANAIKNANCHFDGRKLLEELNFCFIKEISLMLNSI